MQNTLEFRVGSLEVVVNVRLVRIESIWVVLLLIVDVHLNIGKNWVQNLNYRSNEMNWSLFHILLFQFFVRFCLLLVLLFNFCAIVIFVTTTFDKFQFQSQVRMSQSNVKFPLSLKLKFIAVFINWCSRLNFLLVGRQNIVNYWDFPSKGSRNCQKKWYRKLLDMINEKVL